MTKDLSFLHVDSDNWAVAWADAGVQIVGVLRQWLFCFSMLNAIFIWKKNISGLCVNHTDAFHSYYNENQENPYETLTFSNQNFTHKCIKVMSIIMA